MPIDQSQTKPAGKQRGTCDGCGRVITQGGRSQSFICCVYAPNKITGWCAWCGKSLQVATHFCGPGCSHEYAMDVIESGLANTGSDAAAEE